MKFSKNLPAFDSDLYPQKVVAMSLSGADIDE